MATIALSTFNLAKWQRSHAALSVLGVGVCVASLEMWPLAASTLLSFSWLIWQHRGRYSARGGFGIANTITSARLLLTLAMMLAFAFEPGLVLGLAVVVIVILDGIDGRVARRRGEASEFGAHFDVETDALMVMALSLMLMVRDVAGYWVLLAGLWRYFYLAVVHLFEPPNPERSRTLLARTIYVLLTSCFALALAVPPPWGEVLAAVGTVSVSFSFLVSFWNRYARRVPRRG